MRECNSCFSHSDINNRAPTIGVNIDPNRHLPPCDVPEARLFALLQKHRRQIVSFLDKAFAEHRLDTILRDIVRVTMRNSSFEYDGWHKESAGRYIAVRADLKVDIQTAEITWRRDELKPVPDSMTQFTDFESVSSLS